MSSPGTPGSGGSGGSPLTVAAERVTAAGVVELPLLTKTNYHEWSLVMQVSLEAFWLWTAVVSDNVVRREDRRVLAAILEGGVPSELKAGLAVKESAKAAWDAVKKMRVGDDRVKAANVERLSIEFENAMFRDGESIDAFVLRIEGIAGSLRELGVEMKGGRVVRKVLRRLPRRYKQVVISIQMLLDLDAMSVDELLGRLRVAEEQEPAEEETASAPRLLLSEE
ncbi:hypothetical protein ACP4OV_031012 [Aristida adscensionis]